MTHSAQVELNLRIGDRLLSLSHVEPEVILVMFLPESIAPCFAELMIQIDDDLQIRPIYLPDGIAKAATPIRYQTVKPAIV
jgi:hypothetical protein